VLQKRLAKVGSPWLSQNSFDEAAARRISQSLEECGTRKYVWSLWIRSQTNTY